MAVAFKPARRLAKFVPMWAPWIIPGRVLTPMWLPKMPEGSRRTQCDVRPGNVPRRPRFFPKFVFVKDQPIAVDSESPEGAAENSQGC